MKPKIVLQAVLVLLITLLLAVGVSAPTRGRTGQPLRFSHQKHTEELEMECSECHEYAAKAEFAGRPSTELCAVCHEEALTETPEEATLLEYVASGDEIPWQRLYRVPDHVYYSHRRHVTVAGIECATCHGDIGLSTFPPEKPLNKLSMDFCMECHEDQQASTDCNACHR